MKYVRLSDLTHTIRENIWKVPRDIDFIITIPRSGTIAGSIISEFLNVPLIDIKSFIEGVEPSGGGRLRYYNQKEHNTKRVLVVDDTVFSGLSKVLAKEKLAPFTDYEFIYLAVYLEGPGEKFIDIWLEDLRPYTNNFTEIVLYEWNIFHHNEDIMESCLYDIDGVLCLDPPDERNEEAYLNYIRNATPLFTPTTTIGGFVTFRLIKNKEITQEWLTRNGISYGFLAMFNAQTWEERARSGITPGNWKGMIYKALPHYRLFVESEPEQAKTIHEVSGKQVLCVGNNTMYG